MSNTVNMANFIRSQLRTINPRSFYEEMPQGTTFPYVLFRLRTQSKRENRKDVILEIDVFTNTGNSISDLENTVDAIETKFDRMIYSDNTQNLQFFIENILELSEMYQHLRRKQLRFLLKFYKK